MTNIILTIALGAVAGVATYLSCIAIWGIKPAFNSGRKEHEKAAAAEHAAEIEPFDVSEDTIMRLSIDIKQQELALAKDGTTVSGSYINIERNMDGMQIRNKIFLN
ncbi:MAG: hypothetical protein ACNS64_04095 [Candidatus Halalkalibacterium sp. M3_1C_030]